MVAAGELVIPGGRADIADPDVIDSSYRSIALPALLSMWTGLEHLEPHLGETDVPLLVMTSTNDHVVAPEESDVLAARWSGPVERLSLERSFHMATLDLDREELRDHTRRFVRRVCR